MKHEPDDGGPAFPDPQQRLVPSGQGGTIDIERDRERLSRGMTLRQWFAGRAMQGMIAAHKCEAFDGTDAAAVTMAAYKYADAMIAGPPLTETSIPMLSPEKMERGLRAIIERVNNHHGDFDDLRQRQFVREIAEYALKP